MNVIYVHALCKLLKSGCYRLQVQLGSKQLRYKLGTTITTRSAHVTNSTSTETCKEFTKSNTAFYQEQIHVNSWSYR